MSEKELVIVIPAYEPDHLLIELINKLNQFFEDFTMVVVNDGSKGKDDIFNTAKELPNVVYLEHEINKGKGVALKTAFDYISKMDGNHIIVTADSDGQHKPEDILRVADFYKKYKSGLVLGSRKFEGEIPARSAFGNNVARGLLMLCNNKHLNDTQTGLRAFGSELLPFMLATKGDRYEYEMNMLVECARQGIEINEIAIATVYINNNENSHFRPVRDFTRICGCILKYTIPFILTLLVNIAALIGFYFVFKDIFMEMQIMLVTGAVASVTALLVNVILNWLGLFNGNLYMFKHKRMLVSYLSQAVMLCVLETGLVSILYFTNNVALAISVTLIIMVLGYLLLQYFTAPKSLLNEE